MIENYLSGFGLVGEGDSSTYSGFGMSGAWARRKARLMALSGEFGFIAPVAIYRTDTDTGTGVMQTIAASALSPLQDRADYLTIGFWEDSGESPNRFNLGTSGFLPNNGELSYNVSGYSADPDGLTDTRAALVREAFKIFEDILGITLTETTSARDEVDIFCQ